MGEEKKEKKEKSTLSAEDTAALLRGLADRISGVGSKGDKDPPPSTAGLQKLELSLKRAKDSATFVVKCKVKPKHHKDSRVESTGEREQHPQSVGE
jgi:hypothetical protein